MTRRINPDRITAVTFTNQAAGEIRDRLQQAGEQGSSFAGLQTGTFHAICLRFLKERGVRVLLADEPGASVWQKRFCTIWNRRRAEGVSGTGGQMEGNADSASGRGREKGEKESGRTAAYEAMGKKWKAGDSLALKICSWRRSGY